PKRPPNNYLQSKWDQELLAEKYHQTEKLPYTSIRPTGVSGPRAVYGMAARVTYNNVQMFQFLAELLGKPFSVMPAVPVSLVKGLAIAAATVENFISKKILKKTPKLEKDTAFFLGGDFWYTNEKLKKTGFQFAYPDGKEGFRETIPWYRENGLIP